MSLRQGSARSERLRGRAAEARGGLGPHETGAHPARLLLLQILLRMRADWWPGSDQSRDLGDRLVSRGEHPCRSVVRTRPAATDPTHVRPPPRPVPADPFRLNSATTDSSRDSRACALRIRNPPARPASAPCRPLRPQGLGFVLHAEINLQPRVSACPDPLP
jgi:hypothetical protein